jgi:hypothetical protein
MFACAHRQRWPAAAQLLARHARESRFPSAIFASRLLRSDSPPNDPDGIRQYAAKNVPFWQSVLREASSLPGVHSVALSDWRPGRDAAVATLMFKDRANDPARLPTIDGSWVSADSSKLFGDPVLAGRSFQRTR